MRKEKRRWKCHEGFSEIIIHFLFHTRHWDWIGMRGISSLSPISLSGVCLRSIFSWCDSGRDRISSHWWTTITQSIHCRISRSWTRESHRIQGMSSLSLFISDWSLIFQGEVLLSLTYQPSLNNLTVVIVKVNNCSLILRSPQARIEYLHPSKIWWMETKATQLQARGLIGTPDPYAKLSLRDANGKRLAKKRTHVKRAAKNPVFNESFIFELPQSQLMHAVIDIQVSLQFAFYYSVQIIEFLKLWFIYFDIRRAIVNSSLQMMQHVNGHSETIGRVVLNGADSHVADVISRSDRQIAQWHVLE